MLKMTCRPLTSLLLILAVACVLAMPVSRTSAAQIVGDAQSSYQIYIAGNAPSSVKSAATELAHCIKLATNVELKIVQSDELPQGKVISLGVNASSQQAGLSADHIALEGYRIIMRGQNLYILGQDTPDRKTTAQGGFSTGTRNGVYTFLENQLDVRFLFPGDVGLDVPARQQWSVPDDLDLTEKPGFLSRRLPYVQNKMPAVQQWSARLKLGRSLQLNHGHNWTHTVPASLYEQHPDWFAMQAGKRIAPVGRYKLETTNPQLVDHFAQAAVDSLKRAPQQYSYSLSPSDSAGWSTSASSLALSEKDPQGQLSITPLILDFYRNVALKVHAQLPDAAVAGYIYAAYLYPPSQKVAPLPDNLHLVLAPSIDYGYTLFRQDVQADFVKLLSAWDDIAPNLAYYDLPNWLRQKMGAIPAPGVDILKFIFPKLADAHVTSVYIYGQDAWGNGALTNYLLAKLMWNPHADPEVIAAEFLSRAYGPQAGPSMQKIYQLLDQTTATYYQEHDDARYTLTPPILKNIYGSTWPQVEALFLKAKEAATEKRHQQRLAMFEKNLLVMRWNLVYHGVIKEDESSPLARSNQAIETLMAQPNDDLALGSEIAIEKAKPVAVDHLRARLGKPVTNKGPSRYRLRGQSRTLIYPQEDVDVTITTTDLATRGETVRYTLVDSIGKLVQSGLLTTDPISFAGSENQLYFLDIHARSASYQLKVDGAPWAVKTTHNGSTDDTGLHMLAHTTTLYFTPITNAKTFTLTLHSAAPGETAAIEIFTPQGKSLAKLETVNAPTDRKTIDTQNLPGIWSITFPTPSAGNVDDVYIQFDEGVMPWVSLDGRAPLIIDSVR